MEAMDEQAVTNLLVAGGQAVDVNLLNQMGCKVVAHWPKMEPKLVDKGSVIPKDVDLAVLISDSISVPLANMVENLCRKEVVPLVRTRSDWSKFVEAIRNPSKIVVDDSVPVVEPLYFPKERTMASKKKNVTQQSTTTQQPTQEVKVDKRREGGKNVERAKEKIEYLREKLKLDRTTPTAVLQEGLIAKFGKGMAPMKINEIREQEFGIKYGPRGILLDAKTGERIDTPTVTSTGTQLGAAPKMSVSQGPTNISPVSSTKRLSALIEDLRREMEANHITNLTLPRAGAPEAVYEVRQTLH